MVTVYLGRDESSGRESSVTVLGSGWKASRKERELLRRAIEARAALEHTSLAAVYEMVEEGDELAIAEEHVEGRPLDALLVGPTKVNQRSATMTTAAAMEILVPILDGLAYLHARGVVHRAVQPGNVVSAGDHIRLRGLGMAAVAEVWRDAAIRIPLAPRPYLSPEQLARSESDAHTDIYSSGVILHGLLAGQPAGEDDDGRWAHRAEPPDLRNLVPSVPAGVSAAVAIALRAEPRQRFHSAEAFRQALEEGVVGFLPIPPGASVEPADATPAYPSEATTVAPFPGTPPPVETPRRAPDWQPRAVAAAACIAVVGGLLWVQKQQTRPRSPGPAVLSPRNTEPVDLAPEPEASEPLPPAEPPLGPPKEIGAVAASPRPAVAKTAPAASQPAPDAKASLAAALAASQAEIDRLRAEVRQEIERIGAALDAQELAGLQPRLDALAGRIERYPAEMREERDELQALRHRLLAAQVQDVSWKARLDEIQRLIDRGKYAEADGLAADLSQEPGVSDSVATEARRLSEQAQEGIHQVWKGIQLGPTENSLRTPQSKPPHGGKRS